MKCGMKLRIHSPNLKCCIVEVWEWISKFIPHFVMDVITYSCQDLKLSHVSRMSAVQLTHLYPRAPSQHKEGPSRRSFYLYNGNLYTIKTTSLF